MAIDYYQISEDLKTILVAGPAAGYTNDPKHVRIEAMDRDQKFDDMPYINIRLIDADLELTRIPNGYYGHIIFEIDVVTFDLSLFSKAAQARDDLLGDAQDAIQENRVFSSVIQTSILGNVSFGVGTPEGANGHVAMCTFQLDAEVDIEST